MQSPAGTLLSSLSRRSPKGGEYIGCTVATLSQDATSLTASALEDIISSYSIGDVWSTEKFLDRLYVQRNGTDTSIPVELLVADFVTKHGVETLLVSKSFDLMGFASSAQMYAVASACNLGNDPYVAAFPI